VDVSLSIESCRGKGCRHLGQVALVTPAGMAESSISRLNPQWGQVMLMRGMFFLSPWGLIGLFMGFAPMYFLEGAAKGADFLLHPGYQPECHPLLLALG